MPTSRRSKQESLDTQTAQTQAIRSGRMLLLLHLGTPYVKRGNQAAVRYGIRTGKQIFISPSLDTGVRCDKNTMIWTGDHKTQMLATWNILCIDAPAIITANIAVEMNVANGSKVFIKEVIPHPEDHEGWSTIHSDQVVRLSRPPISIFVELASPEQQMNYNYHPHDHAGKANDSHSQRIRRRISIDSRQENIRPHSNSIDPRVLHVRLPCPRKWAQQRDLRSEKASIRLSALPKHIRHVIQSNQLGRPSNPETVRG